MDAAQRMTDTPRPGRFAAVGTDRVDVAKYNMVNDSGVLVNPALVAGQAHSGVVQGIGQAFWESVRHDEAGCAGSLPAVMNALVDALSEFGITHIDMPATPQAVWAAIAAARREA